MPYQYLIKLWYHRHNLRYLRKYYLTLGTTFDTYLCLLNFRYDLRYLLYLRRDLGCLHKFRYDVKYPNRSVGIVRRIVVQELTLFYCVGLIQYCEGVIPSL